MKRPEMSGKASNVFEIHPPSPDKGHPNKGHLARDWLKFT